MDTVKNDYDRIVEDLEKLIEQFACSTHGAMENSDSVTQTKNGFIEVITGLHKLKAYTQGLADSHRLYYKA